jgi:hypothetical protein
MCPSAPTNAISQDGNGFSTALANELNLAMTAANDEMAWN